MMAICYLILYAGMENVSFMITLWTEQEAVLIEFAEGGNIKVRHNRVLHERPKSHVHDHNTGWEKFFLIYSLVMCILYMQIVSKSFHYFSTVINLMNGNGIYIDRQTERQIIYSDLYKVHCLNTYIYTFVTYK